jgi:type I restriction enzyme S subunit
MDALNAGSTGQIELSRTEAMDLPVPVAPLSEQHRIVEKIETLLSDIANGVESLNAVDRNLSSYRQSVLKAAVTGDLTRDWRRNRSQVFEAVPNSRSLPFKPPFEVPAGA